MLNINFRPEFITDIAWIIGTIIAIVIVCVVIVTWIFKKQPNDDD